MKKLTLIFATLVLAGCGLAYEVQLRDEVLADPNVTYTTKEAIKAKKIKVGMTKREVTAAWGNPCSLCYGTRKSSEGETWEYNTFGSGRHGIGNGTYLHFNRQGKLVYWNGN